MIQGYQDSGASAYPYIITPAKTQISIGPLEGFPVFVNPGEMFYYMPSSAVFTFDGIYPQRVLTSNQWYDFYIGSSSGVGSTKLSISTDTTQRGLVVQGTASSTANLTEWWKGSSSVTSLDVSGNFTTDGNVVYNQTITTSSVTSYTLGLIDSGRVIEFTASSTISVTIPSSSSVSWKKGTRIDILQAGTGSVQITSTDVLNYYSPTSGTCKTKAQWSAITLLYRGSGSWVGIGNIA